MSIAVALARQADYAGDALRQKVGEILEAAQIVVAPGDRVLVKPNLLMARPLACASPEITGAVCQWLLDHGARVEVADSPGFGTVAHVAKAIGLEQILKPLGVPLRPMDRPVKTVLPMLGRHSSLPVVFRVSTRALEADQIFSVARVKAHRQMRVTLCVKNCFGCVPGIRKALIHARLGEDTAFFADCQAALWAILPPVAAFVDGVTAMSGTGPGDGQAFPLGIIGASASAPALDAAMMRILNLEPDKVPLAMALRRRVANGDARAGLEAHYPLESPESLRVSGFVTPVNLVSASFSPIRLIKSCLKRIWLARKD